ncbi:hypothetical protein DPV78_012144 [Talaromyces pinophilus]|nr:hypothetical protein DPV78_012144 [Talaromyces pinophilus]
MGEGNAPREYPAALPAANTSHSVPGLCAVSSDAIYMAKLDTIKTPFFQRLDDERPFLAFEWYPKTGLLLMIFIKELASRVSPDDVLTASQIRG